VVAAMKYWAGLTVKAKRCLQAGNTQGLGQLIDANFDRRRRIYRISEANVRMVETARSVGASAKFTGSGGAIVGTYEDEAMFRALKAALRAQQVKVLKPRLVAGKRQESE